MIKKLGFAGFIGFIADLLTFFQFFTWLLELCGMDITKAENINKWISIGGLALIGLSFVLILLYTHIRQKEVGTHGIACDIVPFIWYKLMNRNHTIISYIHRDIYHCAEEVKSDIFNLQKERFKRSQDNEPPIPLTLDDIKGSMRNLLDAFQKTFVNVFHVDMTISIYLISESNGKTILKRWLLQRSSSEGKRAEKRLLGMQYLVSEEDDKDLDFYTKEAKLPTKNKNLKKNCLFDYVLLSDQNAYLSNDLKIDEQNEIFYSTSNHYRQFYESMGVFAIVPPACEKERKAAIKKGLLTFDCHKTNRFSEEECTLIMGLMAHFVYDILESMKFVNYE